MRSWTRSVGLLLVALAAVPMAGVFDVASANTELVPAARLVAPFIDISSGRDTFLLIVNVSPTFPLTRTPFNFTNLGNPGVTVGDSVGWGVHLEFYAASCTTNSRTVDMTPSDIDQLDLLVNPNLTGQLPGGPTTASQSGVEGRGWVDIDVRRTPAAATDPSVQANLLMGTVVISDFANDFALAFPMASSIGSAAHGLGAVIVQRSPAILWSGRYEPFPPRVFVPAYFAEGTGTGSAAGQVFSTFLAIAGPADGNWSGVDRDGNTSVNTGEAPGQIIGDGGTGGTLVNAPNSLLFDGCEQRIDRPIEGHYINNSLGSIFGAVNLNRANWTAANCSAKIFPGLDEFSGQPVGWVDIPNTALSRGTAGSSRPTSSSTGGIGVNRERGLVGVFVESVAGGTPTAFKLGDTTRLWGDCSFIQIEDAGSPGCAFGSFSGSGTSPNFTACDCSLVDNVCHLDTAASPTSFPTDLLSDGRCTPAND
jgi:hypothetical protein